MTRKPSLADLLGNRASLAVLARFLENPSASLTAAQLQRHLGLAKGTTRRWLAGWERYSLLARTPLGPALLYQLNRDHPVTKQLKRLFTIAAVSEALAGADFPGHVYLYGSAARGEDAEQSDIDLLIIGKAQPLPLIERIQRRASRPVKPLFFTPLEYAALSRKDPALSRNLDRERVEVL